MKGIARALLNPTSDANARAVNLRELYKGTRKQRVQDNKESFYNFKHPFKFTHAYQLQVPPAAQPSPRLKVYTKHSTCKTNSHQNHQMCLDLPYIQPKKKKKNPARRPNLLKYTLMPHHIRAQRYPNLPHLLNRSKLTVLLGHTVCQRRPFTYHAVYDLSPF